MQMQNAHITRIIKLATNGEPRLALCPVVNESGNTLLVRRRSNSNGLFGLVSANLRPDEQPARTLGRALRLITDAPLGSIDAYVGSYVEVDRQNRALAFMVSLRSSRITIRPSYEFTWLNRTNVDDVIVDARFLPILHSCWRIDSAA